LSIEADLLEGIDLHSEVIDLLIEDFNLFLDMGKIKDICVSHCNKNIWKK